MEDEDRRDARDREGAVEANEHGNAASDANEIADAEALYRRAIALDPTYAAPWFNLGILLKHDRAWPEARRCAEQALALGTANREGALWNLGIAATALGDWPAARAAWRGVGITIPDGEGPLDLDFGLTPVRMRTENHEVVWCRRIDPARAIVRSIPLPESGRRFGDLLLHDGAPNGYRKLGDQERAVFDELELLAPSSFSTFRVRLHAAEARGVEELVRAFAEAGLGAEDWTSSVQILCRACSEGRPHEHEGEHGKEKENAGTAAAHDVWSAKRDFAAAAVSMEAAVRVLDAWARAGAHGSRGFEAPEEVVEGAPLA
jgi:tetratricopeptide (TPR) repeat protein